VSGSGTGSKTIKHKLRRKIKMKFRKLGAAAIAAAVMATSAAVVASADDYTLNQKVEFSDFAIQFYGMGTTNWSWVSGGTTSLDASGSASVSAKNADLNPKGDDTVQFGLQFYLNHDASNNAEFEIGDKYSAKVTYSITGANGVIEEGTIDLNKDIADDPYNPFVDGALNIYMVEIDKADLEALGDVSATISVSELTYTVGGTDGKVEAEAAAAAPAPAAGNVDAATDSSKGSPDTGIADVAAVAGLGVLAAGAVIASKKRK
jgi:hypothetical protein